MEDCKGFTLFDSPDAPVVVVSKKDPLEVGRIFTLIHEYGHLLLMQPDFSDLNDRNPVEAFCNRFAAGFLMPRTIIQQLLGEWPNSPREWDPDYIRDWANELNVSQQSLALRFEQLELAPKGFFARFRGQQHHRGPDRRKSTGGNNVSTHVNELGDRFTRTILAAEEDDKILSTEAA